MAPMMARERDDSVYMNIPSGAIYAGKWVISIVLSVWVGLPVPIQTLCFLMLMDYASGVIVARRWGVWSTKQGIDGLWRKALTLLFGFACHYLSKVTKLNFDAGSAWACACCFNEFSSIMDNCNKAGVYVPSVALKILQQAKYLVGEPAQKVKIKMGTKPRKKRIEK